jgi:hypothetical protein
LISLIVVEKFMRFDKCVDFQAFILKNLFEIPIFTFCLVILVDCGKFIIDEN